MAATRAAQGAAGQPFASSAAFRELPRLWKYRSTPPIVLNRQPAPPALEASDRTLAPVPGGQIERRPEAVERTPVPGAGPADAPPPGYDVSLSGYRPNLKGRGVL